MSMWQERLSQLIETRAGLVLSKGTKERLGSFVARRCTALGIATAENYTRLLETNQLASEFQEIVNTVTVSKTAFFRYPKQLDALCEHLLPELDRQLAPGRSINVWCAAVSTGEEPYSVAMALDHFGWFARRRITLLGTDINSMSLARARRAEYHLDRETLARLPAYASKYLTNGRTENHVRVVEQLRTRVELARANLNALSLPSDDAWHVVLCCNVLIYFDEVNRRRVISDIQARMAEQSALLLGGAEIAAPTGTAHRVHNVGGCFVHLRGDWRELGLEAPPAREPLPATTQLESADHVAPTSTDPPAAPAVEAAVAPERTPAALGRSEPDWRDQVQALLDANRFEDACTLLEAVRERDPFCQDAHFLCGQALRALGRHDEAEGAFRRTVFLDPNFALARYELGLLRHLRGDFAAAVREYQRALASLSRPSSHAATLSGARDAEQARGVEKFMEHLCTHNRELALAGMLPNSRAGP